MISSERLFTNYVDKSLAFFDTYPPALTFSMIWRLTKSTFLDHLPTSSCKRTLWTTPDSKGVKIQTLIWPSPLVVKMLVMSGKKAAASTTPWCKMVAVCGLLIQFRFFHSKKSRCGLLVYIFTLLELQAIAMGAFTNYVDKTRYIGRVGGNGNVNVM